MIELGARVQFEPESAKRLILAAVKSTGSIRGAAGVLELNERTLRRYIHRLGLHEQIAQERRTAS